MFWPRRDLVRNLGRETIHAAQGLNRAEDFSPLGAAEKQLPGFTPFDLERRHSSTEEAMCQIGSDNLARMTRWPFV